MASNGLHGLIPGDIPELRVQHSVQAGQVQYILHETRGVSGRDSNGERCTYIQCTENQSKSSKMEGEIG